MTSKERAELRAQANTLEPIFQIGKGGVTDAVVNQLEEVFNTHELVKIKVHLESSPELPRATAGVLCEKTGCEPVQVIGGVIVLYRYNKKLHEPKKKPTKAQLIPPSKRRSISSRTKLYSSKYNPKRKDSN